MSAGHTPGPWLKSWDCDPPTGSDASPKYDGFEVVDSEGWPVAFIPVHFVFPPIRHQQAKRALDWDEAASNLQLISAAPELLAALIAATAALDNVGMQDTYIDFDQVRDAKANARAAIAKATGETP